MRENKLPMKSIYMRKILDLDLKEFGLQIWIMLHFTRFGLEIFRAAFIIILIRCFTGVGLENVWTTKVDYNNYILKDLEFKILGLRIGISNIIYLTGLRFESSGTTNLNYD